MSTAGRCARWRSPPRTARRWCRTCPRCRRRGGPASTLPSGEGYFGPANLPKEIVTRLNAEIRKIVEKPEIKAQLATLGMDAFSGTPEELGTFVGDQLVLWEKLIRNAGIEKQ